MPQFLYYLSNFSPLYLLLSIFTSPPLLFTILSPIPLNNPLKYPSHSSISISQFTLLPLFLSLFTILLYFTYSSIFASFTSFIHLSIFLFFSISQISLYFCFFLLCLFPSLPSLLFQLSSISHLFFLAFQIPSFSPSLYFLIFSTSLLKPLSFNFLTLSFPLLPYPLFQAFHQTLS